MKVIKLWKTSSYTTLVSREGDLFVTARSDESKSKLKLLKHSSLSSRKTAYDRIQEEQSQAAFLKYKL